VVVSVVVAGPEKDWNSHMHALCIECMTWSNRSQQFQAPTRPFTCALGSPGVVTVGEARLRLITRSIARATSPGGGRHTSVDATRQSTGTGAIPSCKRLATLYTIEYECDYLSMDTERVRLWVPSTDVRFTMLPE
jgi:hypothetical protein